MMLIEEKLTVQLERTAEKERKELKVMKKDVQDKWNKVHERELREIERGRRLVGTSQGSGNGNVSS